MTTAHAPGGGRGVPASLFLDATSLYEVLHLMRFRVLSDAYEWAWRSSVEVTAALVFVDHISLAPTPQPLMAGEGPYNNLLTLLPFLSPAAISQASAALALSETQEWIARNPLQLLNALQRLNEDQQTFGRWLREGAFPDFPEYLRRLGDLGSDPFATQVASIIGLDTLELQRLWKSVPQWSRVKVEDLDSEMGRTLTSAYVLASLCRGVFHDRVASLVPASIIHHTVRMSVLTSDVPRQFDQVLAISYAKRALAVQVLLSAFRAGSLAERLTSWAFLVNHLRGSVKARDLTEHDEGVEAAHSSAERLIRGISNRTSDTRDATAESAARFGELEEFRVSPWPRFVSDVTPKETLPFEDLTAGARGRVGSDWSAPMRSEAKQIPSWPSTVTAIAAPDTPRLLEELHELDQEAQAIILVRLAEEMGYFQRAPGMLMSDELVGRAIDAIASAGVAEYLQAQAAFRGSAENVTTRALDALALSPAPEREFRSLDPLFGREVLLSMIGANESDDAHRAVAVSERLHFVAIIVAILRGSYNEHGVRGWFVRPRRQLEGRTPLAVLHGQWDVSRADVASVMRLATDLLR